MELILLCSLFSLTVLPSSTVAFLKEEHLRRALGSLPSFLPPPTASPSSGWPSLFSPTTYLLLQGSQFRILIAQLPDFTSAFLTWPTAACSAAQSCSALCDPMEPVRLLCPWDFADKNTGVATCNVFFSDWWFLVHPLLLSFPLSNLQFTGTIEPSLL